jgi:hypothetical protein
MMTRQQYIEMLQRHVKVRRDQLNENHRNHVSDYEFEKSTKDLESRLNTQYDKTEEELGQKSEPVVGSDAAPF